jgi:tetratricopeptide (TPR) repeat protein
MIRCTALRPLRAWPAPRLSCVLLALIGALLLSACTSHPKPGSEPAANGSDGAGDEPATSSDSALLSRLFYLRALDMENRGLEEAGLPLIERSWAYDHQSRWLGFRLLEGYIQAERDSDAIAMAPFVQKLEGDTTLAQMLTLGHTFRLMGKLDSARYWLEQGLARDDENVQLIFELVVTLEAQKNYPALTIAHRRLLPLLDWNEQLVQKQLLLYSLARDTLGQSALYREVWAATEDDSWGVKLVSWLAEQHRPGEAVTTLQELLQRHPGDSYMIELLGRMLQASGKKKEAYQVVIDQFRSDTTRLDLLKRAGVLSYELQRNQEAYATLRAVTARDSADALMFFYLGSVSTLMGDSATAVQAASRSVLLEPTSKGFRAQLGLLSYLIGNYPLAHQAIDSLQRMDSTGREAPKLRASAWTHEAYQLDEQSRDPERQLLLRRQASTLLKQLITTEPSDWNLTWDLATTLERMDSLDQAVPLFEHLLQVRPRDARILNYYGYSLAQRSLRLPYADSLITSALVIDPTNTSYLDSKAWVLYRMDRPEEALVIMRHLEETVMDHREFMEHIAAVLEKLGKRDEALVWLKKLVASYPTAAAASADLQKLREALKFSEPAQPNMPTPAPGAADASGK